MKRDIYPIYIHATDRERLLADPYPAFRANFKCRFTMRNETQALLADILDRINDHEIDRLEELLPWNWTPIAAPSRMWPDGPDEICPDTQTCRRNALFAGHDAGAENWAIIASLIKTCKLNGIDPRIWLVQMLKAILNGQKQSDIDELLPWNYPRNVQAEQRLQKKRRITLY